MCTLHIYAYTLCMCMYMYVNVYTYIYMYKLNQGDRGTTPDCAPYRYCT